ncbi:imidazolonepropionase [Pseudoalteromonas tunicata]|uniref:Imidazolonepropionase n=1 Tax=Pseudoalteromonas tunicata D2 TaxID=87626 RepID=A4C8E6_9GAMM|nr:imidazolonepropionase [Pseudoalteromonas tunicata]ATC93366.1 imidazolonepropionase [Pseudoalteromonas tunicata]AXT32413.1 imidazolonepropionase [Pseudoalteromonas tunicata]EAR28861.1 Imidazolonepropionase (imidazolone-5-propionate hydrolase) [Pseudoalteromonas tunicata D2]MDP4983304.1 imidazolonepropionase [Pseudoalteromonas tunicata]
MRYFDQVIIDVNLATMDPAQPAAYGAIYDAAVALLDGNIAWLGPKNELPEFDTLATPVISGKGKWLTPGLIDCHTHLVFGGSRAKEFEMRLQGVSYQEIAAQGGGIVSTVKATRAADRESLFVAANKRLTALFNEGVTTLEIKSGYGLDLESEIKMLEVAKLLDKHHPITIKTTFLGAHAVPPEYKGDADGYIDLVCEQMLPKIAELGLADAVDAFCEGVGFSNAQTRRVFEKAKALGLPVKLHAEQLSNLAGAQLVAEFNGLSADHIEFLDEAGVKAMAAAGTVAVLLPGAFYVLRETQLPPIELLKQYQVPIAISTDFNPGTSPICSLKLMLNMACTLFRMTPEEALAGVTVHAAKALGCVDRGMLAVGKRADLALWDIEHPAELAYQFGVNPLTQLWINGKTSITR